MLLPRQPEHGVYSPMRTGRSAGAVALSRCRESAPQKCQKLSRAGHKNDFPYPTRTGTPTSQRDRAHPQMIGSCR